LFNYIILNFPFDKYDEPSGAFSIVKHVLFDGKCASCDSIY